VREEGDGGLRWKAEMTQARIFMFWEGIWVYSMCIWMFTRKELNWINIQGVSDKVMCEI
jgi:hypothetical protein